MALGTLARAYDHEKAMGLMELFPHLAALDYPVFPTLKMDYGGMYITCGPSHLTEESLEKLIELAREHGLRVSFGYEGKFRIEFPDDYESRRDFEKKRKE